jgi:hypothetical protein
MCTTLMIQYSIIIIIIIDNNSEREKMYVAVYALPPKLTRLLS